MGLVRAVPVSGTLPKGTKVLSIGLHPRSLDYRKMPEGVTKESLTARIQAANSALGEAGFDVVTCLVDPDPDTAEAAVAQELGAGPFGLAMIGGGVRMVPEHTLVFERLVNVLTEAAPGIRLCFNSSPETTVDALRRWIEP
ncbi:hypothetical protein ABZ958_36825 [Streptomyces sp. NPDC046237]|uniref:hypothetical protein n=1 Tax=Streptomyces sp. NPDC046237 TaxID=3154914 RepID=UPI003408689D